MTDRSPLKDGEYKHREDLLDAAICAWTAALWARWGEVRYQVLGLDEAPRDGIRATDHRAVSTGSRGCSWNCRNRWTPGLLVEAAGAASVLWAQRLGFLLEFVGAGARCVALKDYVQQRARNYTRLLPSASVEGARRSRDWRLIVNASIEVEA